MSDAQNVFSKTRGCIVIACIILAFVATFISGCDRGHDNANKALCQNNMSQLYVGMHVYISKFGGNKYYPPHTGDAFWTCLLGHGEGHSSDYQMKAPRRGDLDVYVCPGSGSDVSSVTPGGKMADYRGPKRQTDVPADNPSALVDGISPSTIILCEEPGHHKGGGNVLYFNGRVEFLTGDAYQAALAQTE